MTDKTFKVAAAPGVLASAWALFITIAGVAGYSMREVAPLFWGATGLAIVAFLVVALRARINLLALYIVPFAASFIVLLPWIYRGMTLFPGTWFWDGWSYLAFGQAFLKYPLDTSLPSIVSPMYELAISWAFKTRFITAGLLALFSASPISSGETQAAAGYLLFFYLFTFACSIGALGAILFPAKPLIKWGYVVFGTVSGYMITALHANNYDQLLAMALLPLLVALALQLQWDNRRQAFTLGVVAAGVLTVYPELAPANLGLPFVVIIWRIWREQPHNKSLLKNVALCAGVFVLAASPAIYSLSSFFIEQLAKAYDVVKGRPGENYFLQFYYPQCAPGALWSLFAPMKTPACEGWTAFVSGALGAVLSVTALYGSLRAAKTLLPIVLCAFLPFMGGMIMLIVSRYDYGAYKLFAVGFPFWAALVVFGVTQIRTRWARPVVFGAALCYAALMGYRVVEIDSGARFKTVEVFREPLKDIPAGSTIALKIADHLSYEWAAYYLRDDNLITIEGNLAYLSEPKSVRPTGNVSYFVSDKGAHSCWGDPISRSEAYAVFRAPGQTDCSP